MANTTRRTAQQIHGTNPQFLIEKVIRSRIYDSLYWKEHCFALTAESLVDKAVELDCVGGTYGGSQRPTAFLCLALKLLQLQPEREILDAYLEAKEFKYLRALAAFYVRLTYPSHAIYETLEPLLEDYRKLRYRNTDGSYRLTHIDDFVDELLTQERVCHIILPRLAQRRVLEDGQERLEPRVSKLEEALLAGEVEEDGEAKKGGSDEDSDGAEGSNAARDRWKEKLRRRKAAREAKAAAAAAAAVGERRSPSPVPLPYNGQDGEDDDVGYASQEESDEEMRDGERYVSRSPSRSRSASPASEQRYISRSPSPASDAGNGGYISRSPSRSPDRD